MHRGRKRHVSEWVSDWVSECVCTKRMCVKFTVLVCKAVRLDFSCQTSAISFPYSYSLRLQFYIILLVYLIRIKLNPPKGNKIVFGKYLNLWKDLMQGELISVAYTLFTYWNQFSLGGICKKSYLLTLNNVIY